MNFFARSMVRHPLVVIGANVLVTAVLGFYALHIRVESSVASMLPAGDREIEYYAKVCETFGSDDIILVGMRADDVFATSTLEKIARVTNALRNIKGVSSVRSITNTPDVAEDPFNKPPLLSRIPPSPGEIEALRKKLAAPILGKTLGLVADDYKGAAIIVFLRNLSDVQYADLQIDRKIREILAKESGPEQFYFTGQSHVTQSLLELMKRDLVRFTPIALALVLG